MEEYSISCNSFYKKSIPTIGTINFLQRISSLSIKPNLYILSGGEKKEIINFLKGNNIECFFKDLLCSEEEKSNHLKNKVLNKNDIFFGDSFTDYKAAKQNNIKFVYVYGFKSEKSCINKSDAKNITLAIKNFSDLLIQTI